MQTLNAERTTVYLTKEDRLKIEEIKKKENLGSLAAVLRWAINDVLK